MPEKRDTCTLMPKVNQDDDFFKLLVDNSTSVYQLADAALVVTYTSNAVENTLGYTPKEVLGKNALELVHPDDKQQVKDWLIDIRRFPDKLLTCEYRIKNKQ